MESGAHFSRMVRDQVGPNAKRKMIVGDLADAESARTAEPLRAFHGQKLGGARNGL